MNKGAGYLAAAISACLMGTLGGFVRASECSAEGCSFARFFIGLLMVAALWSYRIATGREKPEVSAFSLVSGVCIALCILFYFLAINYMGIGITVLLIYAGPVLAALGEACVERRLPPRRDVLLILIAAVGVGMVSAFAPSVPQPGERPHLGFAFALAAGCCYAAYIVCNRLIGRDITLVARTFWQFVAATVVLLFPLMLSPHPYAHLDVGWPFLLCIGATGFAVLVLVAFAMRRLTAIEFGTISYLEPAIAVALGFFLYGEQIEPGQWVGFSLVILASSAKSVIPSKNANQV